MNPIPPNPSSNKRVSFTFDQSKSLQAQPNYRLLYQLHTTYNGDGNDEDMWKAIANSYNFVTGAEFSWKDLNTIWDRAPAMTKRKMGLESINMDEVDASKKPKKSVSITKKTPPTANQSSAFKSVEDEKPKLLPILKLNNTAQSKQSKQMPTNQYLEVNGKQVESETNKSKVSKSTATCSIFDENVNSESKIIPTEDKNIQTDFVDTNKELVQRDLKLKISIQELKLKFLQSQYRRNFGDYGNVIFQHYLQQLTTCWFL